MTSVRIALPTHLRTLARTGAEVVVEVAGVPTITTVLDALEARHPQLRGTVRDAATGQRRAFMRYFADGEDLSLASPDAPLPAAVANGQQPLRLVGAIAGG